VLAVVWQQPPPTTEDEEDVDGAPLGVLSALPVAATIEVEDVDDGPPDLHGDT
jgi:hypothetical protein